MGTASTQLLRLGAWRIRHAPNFDPTELVRRIEREHFPVLARFEMLNAHRGYWKGAPMRGKTALRYRGKQLLLGQDLPRRSEFNNLIWLRERLFAAPRPLAVGEWHARGMIRYQWLFTEVLEDRVPWSEAWSTLRSEDRHHLILCLADEVARMHSLHFVHRDLFPRNLLIAPDPAPQPVAFLDAWAGGPGFGRRGPAYDIACLALDWPETWERAEQALFLERYRQGRAAQGKPIRHVRRWLQNIERQRAAWVHQLEASPRRRGGRPVPAKNWCAPEPDGPSNPAAFIPTRAWERPRR